MYERRRGGQKVVWLARRVNGTAWISVGVVSALPSPRSEFCPAIHKSWPRTFLRLWELIGELYVLKAGRQLVVLGSHGDRIPIHD